jgi:imidazolonepropionase-like amidohydrolase
MRLVMAAGAAMALVTVLAAAQAPPADLAVTNARVYASPEAAPLDNAVIVVGGGRISAVGPRASVPIPRGTDVLDARGAAVTAGFQNSHVHFTEDTWTDAAGQPPSRLAAALQAMLTRHGFTTVVDTGSLLSNTVALRGRIEAGEIAGPRIYTAGTPLYPPRGIPYYIRDTLPAEVLSLLPQPATAGEAAAVVRQGVAGGADVVKLFSGSWIERGRVLPMPIDAATAAAAEAHRAGKPVFAHASNAAGLEVALAARVDVIAHALDDTRGLTAELLRRMKAQNMALVPTLTLFGDAGNADAIRAQVREYQRLDGDLLFGTDVGFLTTYETTREFELLAEAGLTWRQILASLTTTPARRVGDTRTRGRIEPGMAADLVILAADPATDVRAFSNVRYTIRAGRVIYGN